MLPKLREEIDKGAAPGGGAKKKKGGVKDIVVGGKLVISFFA